MPMTAVCDSSSMYVCCENVKLNGAGVGVTLGVGVGVGVGVGDGQAPPPVVSLRTAAETAPLSRAALSLTVSVHVPFGSVTPANAAVMFVSGELFVVACGPAAVVR